MTKEERITKAKERLSAYYEAEMAILSGQEYKIGTRSLKRADLPEVRQAIKDLENLVNRLESPYGPRRSYRITPRDL